MICVRFSALICVLFALFVHIAAFPDGGDYVPPPGPGLVYGGIPYGSVSGDLVPQSSRSLSHLTNQYGNSIDYAPIEQYLR